MPFSGAAGAKTFSRTTGVYSGATAWQQTEAAGRGIRSDDEDVHDQDLAAAINTSLQKDGSNSATANIPFAGFGPTGLGFLGSVAEVSVASSSTCDVLGSGALFNLITGTVTITSLGTGTNRFKIARFNGILTLTHNGTSLILPGAANITTAAGDTMGIVSDASSNARVIWYQRAAGAPINAANTGLTGQLFGLTMSNGTDTTNDIDIAAGTARNSTDVDTMVLASTLTKQLDAGWAVGTNAGGLDTGSIANTTYHVWLIKRPDTGVVDALFSTSATAPTMPSNYTLKRRIGSILRESGSIVLFSQLGDEFLRSTVAADVSATNPGTSAVTRTLSVPIGIKVWAIFNFLIIDTTNNDCLLLLSELDHSDEVPGAVGGNMQGIFDGGAANLQGAGRMMLRTNTSAQIRSRLRTSSAGASLSIATVGWIDTRGRLF